MTTIEDRLACLEAEGAIRQLVSRYSFAVDDHDLEATMELFTDDALVATADGKLGAKGVSALREYFRSRFASTGPASHVTHDIALIHISPDEARGRVSAHAELWRDGQMSLAAFRYSDRYRRTPDGWRFAERLVSYFYYVPVARYAHVLSTRRRVHVDGGADIADYPEPFHG